METLVPLFAIAAALGVGAASPGPSFLMVARTAAARSRLDGIAAALGMGAGGLLFAIAVMAGLKSLLNTVPGLHAGVQLVGGAYLMWIGISTWRGASRPLDTNQALGEGQSTTLRSFLLGLGTQISNPKTAIYYASVFAALLPEHATPFQLVAVPCVVFAVETTWYSIVAAALSSAGPRGVYLKWKAALDRLAGSVMAGLGLKLATDPWVR
jgi:threonine/homoserine/homoserine lactone efflux protein